MFGNYNLDLLQGERLDIETKPHPLSFLKYYAISAYLVSISLFLRWFDSYITENTQLYNILQSIFSWIPYDTDSIIILAVLWATLLLGGFVLGVLWINKIPLFYFILAGIFTIVMSLYFDIIIAEFLALTVAACLWIIVTEGYRRSHKYFVTNYRVIMSKKFLSKEEREIMYDRITDVHIKQGIFGRIFNYGTIIPISASGLGLGSDSASASAVAGTSVRKGFLGIIFGGRKSVQKPRAATYLSLHGVPNPSKIRILIANRQMDTREAPILRRIEGLLKRKEDNDEKENPRENI